MVSEKKPVRETDVYYHALYHHLAHWAAYVAMMGLLVTIGLAVSLTPILANADAGKRKAGVVVSVIGACLGAVYFIKGMDTYGGIVNYEYLPQSYLDKVSTFPHKMMIVIGVLAALGFTGWDIWLVSTL
jgi:hypothetical protein